MRAHLATVQHRPAKALPYVVVVRVGNSRRSTSFAVKRAALAHQAKLNAAVNAGEDFDPQSGEPVSWAANGPQKVANAAAEVVAAKWPNLLAKSRRGVIEACAHVIAACAPRDRAKAYRVAVLALAQQDLSTHDQDTWRSVQQTSPSVSAVDVARVAGLLATNLDGSPASPGTVKKRRDGLAQIVEHATGTRPVLPANGRGTRARTVTKVKPSRIGTVREAITVIDQVSIAGAQVAFALMLYAGLRPAEACGLTWASVDLDAGVLVVADTLPGGGKAFTDSGSVSDAQGPKWRAAGEARSVPLVEPLAQLLSAIGPGRGPVAVNRRGRAHTVTGLGKLWRTARDAAGEGWPADRLDRPYDLRHTRASLALNAGVPVPEVAARLGHAPALLLDTYADVIAADARRWTGVIGEALGS
jgi:integrase